MSLFRPEVDEYRKQRLHGEVVLSQPLSTRVMVATLVVVLAIAGLWVSLGTYARVETVPGILSTDQPTTKIVAIAPGIVTELHAEEGQLVQRGDRLLVVSLDRQVTGGQAVAGRSLDALDARQGIARQQVGLTRQRAASERIRLLAVIDGAREQAASLGDQIALQQQAITSNQVLFDQISSVVERGFVSRVEYERRRQTLINSQQTLAQLRQQLSSRQTETAQASAQLASVAIESQQGAAEIQSSLQGMEQQQAELEGQQSYVITAPISGRVTAVQTAEGRTANPSVPLMVIVPEHAQLRAELYAPTRAIGFVEQGQETRLLFDAFPYQRFGSFGGRVQSVSRVVIDPRESDVPIPLEEPVYRIIVSLDRETAARFAHGVSLQPGMTLQATIVLERQTFLAWLLQPLNAVLNRTS